MTLTSENLNEAVKKFNFWPFAQDHETWISEIVTNLLKAYPEVKEGHLKKSSSFGKHLLPLALKQPLFCRIIFPWLIHDILKSQQVDTKHLCHGLADFFKHYYESKAAIQDTKCVETMLQLVKFLRRQSRGFQTTWEDHFWIDDLNYLHVAFAAFKGHDYISCIVFCDIWCQSVMCKDGLSIGESYECFDHKREFVKYLSLIPISEPTRQERIGCRFIFWNR